ncbi:universal stress protein [Thermomonospora cellulosilytica]|uniref:Nucleotide-binding universal stress UspA family protein n=1 Tax=Thermomonospora cellulosilytica TaxID=1411118 RepID=A0A7W3MVP9_9ACTN|nr:universal stress protein [Thermomonospora cellulosilytica]MBA9002768.1 nucleotide-binding universal stress UspA family protein [Thermomonospora cellulosilytica]
MKEPIIVGVDGSHHGLRALKWAAAEAEIHRVPLRLVHASALLGDDGTVFPEAALARLRAERSRRLDEAAAAVLARSPDLDMRTELLAEEPGQALVRAGRDAALLVVGSRGTGGFDGLLLGSVSLHVAAYATCPVMVIPQTAPDPERASLRIVVGVDEEHPADHVLGWAFAEADRRGVPLTALHAVYTGYGSPRQRIGEEMELSEALAGWTAKYPDLPLTRELPEDKPARALITASQSAALLVVGARRRQGRIGMALGRVNHAVLHHAHCPTVVVPAP